MISWPWPKATLRARSLLSLASLEFRATLRERAGWGGLLAASVLAFIDAALRPHLPIVGGIRASTFAGPLIWTPLIIVFVAGAARRDEAVAAGEVVASRPLPAHVLLASRFAGNGAVALLGYLCVIVCSLLPSLIFAGRFASPLIVLHALARGVVPLLYVAALAYCAVTLARNALAAAVVAVYWLFVQLWGDFLARVFNFALTQNRLSYACLGLGIVLGTMAIRRRLERAAPPAAGRARLPGLALACVAFGLLNAWHTVARSHDKPLRQDPLALTMAGQHLDGGPRVPGFWLPDQHGRAYRISQAGGKVIVVAFWSPEVPDSIPILEVLQAATREFPSDQVTCIAIAVANDHAVARHVAAEAGYAFPMLTDTGTHLAGKVEQSGPLAEAYVVTGLPTLFVADRAHRLTAAISGAASPREQLLAEVGRALALRVPPL